MHDPVTAADLFAWFAIAAAIFVLAALYHRERGE